MAEMGTELFLLTMALIGAVIVISALLSGLVERSGLPQVAIFLALGAAIGPSGLGYFSADVHSPLLRVVGTLSLVLVLFTDAVSLNLAEVRKQKRLSVLVLGPGTLLSAVLRAALAWWLLNLDVASSIVLGFALASSDPVLLRGILRRPGLDARVKQALRLEGGMNDAVLLPIVLVGVAILQQGRPLTGAEWGQLGLKILFLSPLAGFLVGLAAVALLEFARKHAGVRRDYESIYSLGVAFAAYAAGESIHGSGFLSAFAAGVTIAALDVELCDCFLEYGETTAEMALMFAFVLFGTSLIWTGLGIAGAATLLFTAGVFAARLVAFVPALLPVAIPWRDRALIAWFGPTGLSSLLLVLLPVLAGVAGSERLVTICCLVVLCSVVLHGLSPLVLIRAPAATKASPTPPPGALQAPPGEAAPLADPEFITLNDIDALQHQQRPALVVDSRTERTWEESDEQIPGSVRLHPERPVQDAERQNVPKHAVLAILCA